MKLFIKTNNDGKVTEISSDNNAEGFIEVEQIFDVLDLIEHTPEGQALYYKEKSFYYEKEIYSSEELSLISLQKASEAKAYLESTDWIVTKIAELQLEGVDVEPLKVKYADELAERKLMREVV